MKNHFKRCFSCSVNYPLFMYHKNNRTYQNKSDKGKVIECRICTVKRFIKQNGKIVRVVNGKFTIVEKQVTLKNILKEFI